MRVRVRNGDVLAAIQELDNLNQWVRPGARGWLIGDLRGGLEDAGRLVFKQRESLLDEWVRMEDGPEGRQRIIKHSPQGDQYEFTNRTEFERRERELLDRDSIVSVSELLTRAECEAIEKDAERGKGRTSPNLPAVNYAALRCVMEPYARKVDSEGTPPVHEG